MANDNEESLDETTPFPTYEPVSEYPGGKTSATIYFHGLLGLCFNGSDECIVGVNNKASSHQVKVQIKEVGTCADIPVSLPSDFRKMEIRVTNPIIPKVFVYAPTPAPDLVGERYSYVYYGLDLEGPEMHKRHLRKIPGSLSPRFHINNGLFYTYKISKSKFALKQGTSESAIRKVGLVLAADIYLNSPGGKIEFFCNDQLTPCVTLSVDTGERYEIGITNSCEGGSAASDSLTFMSPTDFQQNYLVIDDKDVTPTDRFDLMIKEDSHITGAIKFGSCNMGDIVFSDPAPCLPMGFGRSKDLD